MIFHGAARLNILKSAPEIIIHVFALMKYLTEKTEKGCVQISACSIMMLHKKDVLHFGLNLALKL